MDDTENCRLLKLRYGDEKACVDLIQWLDRVKRSPKFVFSELYEQQRSYVDVIRSLQAKLSEYKSRISYLERNPNKTQISQLETKLAKRDERVQTLRVRSTELNNKLVTQIQEQEASKDRITALKAKLSAEEERTREEKARVAELSKELAARKQELEANQKLIAGWKSHANEIEKKKTAELLIQKETVQKQSARIIDLLNELATTKQRHEQQVADLNSRLESQKQSRKGYEDRVRELNGLLAGEREQQEISKGRVAALTNLLATLKRHQESDKDRIADLENRLTAQTTVYDRSTSDASTTEATFFSFTGTTPTKALPDPPQLSGRGYPSVANWKYLMETKFRENADHFDTPAARLAYLISRTSMEAQEQLVDRLQSKVLKPVTDVPDALEFLEMVYHQPELRTADVQDFRMPDEDLGDFWDYFRAFVWNAVRHELTEEEWPRKLHEFLRWKLNKDIDFFFTYSEGPPKDLAKEVYLRLLREEYDSTDIPDTQEQYVVASSNEFPRENETTDEMKCSDQTKPQSIVESACSIVDLVQARGVKWS